MSVQAIADRVSENENVQAAFKRQRNEEFDPTLIVTIITGILSALADFCERVKPRVERVRKKARAEARRIDKNGTYQSGHLAICKKKGCKSSGESRAIIDATFNDLGYVADDEELQDAIDEVFDK